MFDAGKTRMIELPYGEKNYDGQTDKRTDRQTDLLYQYRASVC